MVVVLLLCAGWQRARAQGAENEATPAWKVDMAARHEALIARNGPGSDAALKAQLLTMRDADQAARGYVNGQARDKKHLQTATNLDEVDAALTTTLKEIVAKDGWPTIAMVGIDASNGAMTVLTHTRDHAWQLSLLPELETMADEQKIDGSALALVIDKELLSEGKLQRYGTQFKFVDGAMAMYGVEEPGTLDERRAKVFLPPMAEYRQMLEQMYHLKATDKVVMATTPEKEPVGR